jgi:hypothetical protein
MRLGVVEAGWGWGVRWSWEGWARARLMEMAGLGWGGLEG